MRMTSWPMVMQGAKNPSKVILSDGSEVHRRPNAPEAEPATVLRRGAQDSASCNVMEMPVWGQRSVFSVIFYIASPTARGFEARFLRAGPIPAAGAAPAPGERHGVGPAAAGTGRHGRAIPGAARGGRGRPDNVRTRPRDPGPQL